MFLVDSSCSGELHLGFFNALSAVMLENQLAGTCRSDARFAIVPLVRRRR